MVCRSPYSPPYGAIEAIQATRAIGAAVNLQAGAVQYARVHAQIESLCGSRNELAWSRSVWCSGVRAPPADGL